MRLGGSASDRTLRVGKSHASFTRGIAKRTRRARREHIAQTWAHGWQARGGSGAEPRGSTARGRGVVARPWSAALLQGPFALTTGRGESIGVPIRSYSGSWKNLKNEFLGQVSKVQRSCRSYLRPLRPEQQGPSRLEEKAGGWRVKAGPRRLKRCCCGTALERVPCPRPSALKPARLRPSMETWCCARL